MTSRNSLSGLSLSLFFFWNTLEVQKATAGVNGVNWKELDLMLTITFLPPCEVPALPYRAKCFVNQPKSRVSAWALPIQHLFKAFSILLFIFSILPHLWEHTIIPTYNIEIAPN